MLMLLVFHPQFRFQHLTEMFGEEITKTSGIVLSVYSIWVLSTIYVDIYLWHRKFNRKDQDAKEIEIYSRTEWGGEDAPIVGKQKWLIVYPAYLLIFAIGWYSVIFVN